MGGHGITNSWTSVFWVFFIGINAFTGTIVAFFVVVYVACTIQLSFTLLGREMVRTSFLVWLGSTGILWWYPLFKETTVLRLDEVVRKKNIATFRMGRLNTVNYEDYRQCIGTYSLPLAGKRYKKAPTFQSGHTCRKTSKLLHGCKDMVFSINIITSSRNTPLHPRLSLKKYAEFCNGMTPPYPKRHRYWNLISTIM